MKFTYKKLEHQTRAVESIVDIFDTGANFFGSVDKFSLNEQRAVVNELDMNDVRLLANINRIQKENRLSKDDITQNIESYDFSIEMETGTGKTYVYIKTILTLAKKYGLTKFIILVPSVAIREGVEKSLKDLREHFVMECGLPQYGAFTYDSGRLGEVRSFATAPGVSIMVTTIQSFNKDTAVLKRKDLDSFHGDIPIDMIAQTRPVIIMDEPQNMETELARSSISELQSLFRLRYSATHRAKYHLLYSLGPVEAYQKHLVKTIDVIGVTEYNPQDMVFDIRSIAVKVGVPLKAHVVIEVKKSDGSFELREIVLKKIDDLYRKTKKNEKYKNLRVEAIDATNGSVELSNQEVFYVHDVKKNKDTIFRAQISQTIKTHMEKQMQMSDTKVLSLFFIDKVDNYIHDGSMIRTIFEEEFEKLKKKYDFFVKQDAKKVHSGYFTKKSKTSSEVVDTSGKTAKDRDTFKLIMQEKERLLSFEETVSFVFSHSALREGWDNPNIFQICTLQQTHSENDKRQKIGRGLRLPVNRDGVRTETSSQNILTVIANESYEQYVRELQTEYRDSGQSAITPPQRKPKKISVRKEILEQEAFKMLWSKINRKTQYAVTFDETRLIEDIVKKFDAQVADVNSLSIMVSHVRLNIDEKTEKFTTIFQNSPESVTSLNEHIFIDDIIKRISAETNITQKTVYKILTGLSQVGKLNLIFENPEEFTRTLSVYAQGCLNDIVVNNGLTYTETGDVYEVSIFADYHVNAVDNVVECDKSVFDNVVCDSDGEKGFASNLDKRDDIKLFVKLPSAFKIDTPMGGTYNPDWAIVKEENGKEILYLVRETKFAGDNRNTVLDELRTEEKLKIECGKKHFDAINVDFKVTTQKDLSDL